MESTNVRVFGLRDRRTKCNAILALEQALSRVSIGYPRLKMSDPLFAAGPRGAIPWEESPGKMFWIAQIYRVSLSIIDYVTTGELYLLRQIFVSDRILHSIAVNVGFTSRELNGIELPARAFLIQLTRMSSGFMEEKECVRGFASKFLQAVIPPVLKRMRKCTTRWVDYQPPRYRQIDRIMGVPKSSRFANPVNSAFTKLWKPRGFRITHQAPDRKCVITQLEQFLVESPMWPLPRVSDVSRLQIGRRGTMRTRLFEMYGDAVAAVCQYILQRRMPSDWTCFEMQMVHEYMVSNKVFSMVAPKLGVELSELDPPAQNQENFKPLADALEALFGAVALDIDGDKRLMDWWLTNMWEATNVCLEAVRRRNANPFERSTSTFRNIASCRAVDSRFVPLVTVLPSSRDDDTRCYRPDYFSYNTPRPANVQLHGVYQPHNTFSSPGNQVMYWNNTWHHAFGSGITCPPPLIYPSSWDGALEFPSFRPISNDERKPTNSCLPALPPIRLIPLGCSSAFIANRDSHSYDLSIRTPNLSSTSSYIKRDLSRDKACNRVLELNFPSFVPFSSPTVLDNLDFHSNLPILRYSLTPRRNAIDSYT